MFLPKLDAPNDDEENGQDDYNPEVEMTHLSEDLYMDEVGNVYSADETSDILELPPEESSGNGQVEDYEDED